MNRDAAWFDDLVRQEGSFDPFAARGWLTLTRAFEEMVPSVVAEQVLDIGCGTGSSRRIYRRARKYIGLDHSLAAIAFAQRSGAMRFAAGGDALQLPIRTNSVDVVAFSSVLHHLPDRVLALREAHRVLRSGGSVFAFDPNLLHPAMAIFRHPRSPLYRSEGVSPEERPLLPSELERSFREAGFTRIDQRAQADIPYREVAVGGLNRALGLYNAADRLLDRSGLGRWFGAFVLTVARRE